MHKRKSLFLLIAVLLLGFLASCCSARLPLPAFLSADTPTPTATMTFTSTYTPLPTKTFTPTPTPPVNLIPCANSDACSEGVYIREYLETVGLLDEADEGEQPFEVEVPYNLPLRFGISWIAIDDETLADNMQKMTFFFEIDGQPYLDKNDLIYEYYPDVEDPSIVYSSVFIDYLLTGWRIGEPHTVSIGFRFDQSLSDGWNTYYLGETMGYSYRILPVELPTATPTPSPTNTPQPRPTAVPPTPTVACELGTTIEIKNDTGGQLTLYFTGPVKYTFTIAPGTRTLQLCTGQYSYTAYGCGGSSRSGSAGDGDEIEFWCE